MRKILNKDYLHIALFFAIGTALVSQPVHNVFSLISIGIGIFVIIILNNDYLHIALFFAIGTALVSQPVHNVFSLISIGSGIFVIIMASVMLGAKFDNLFKR
jgi:energy-converting hydrogenase Eha subunit C